MWLPATTMVPNGLQNDRRVYPHRVYYADDQVPYFATLKLKNIGSTQLKG